MKMEFEMETGEISHETLRFLSVNNVLFCGWLRSENEPGERQ
jgi:hypothetical protein